MKRYLVGTFARRTKTGRLSVTAYTRYFHEDWDGCVVFEIESASGEEAKAKAITKRREYEAAVAVRKFVNEAR